MSMFRRSSPDAGHAQHDTLLIAQYAARDPLTPEQVAQAAALVGSCGECASLAADLGAISRSVATEPVPRRRRDYRIDAKTAAELRGSPLQRFMRRLAMPGSAPLRPLAAGVMSIGLVLVIAGNVIPTAERATSVPGALEAPGAFTQDAAATFGYELDAVVTDGAERVVIEDARRQEGVPEAPDSGLADVAEPAGSPDVSGAKKARREAGVVGGVGALEPATEATAPVDEQAPEADGAGLAGLREGTSEALRSRDADGAPEALGSIDDELRRDNLAGAEAQEMASTFADDYADPTAAENELMAPDGSAVQKAAIGDGTAIDRAAGSDIEAPAPLASALAGRSTDPNVGAASLEESAFRSAAEPADDFGSLIAALGVGLVIAGAVGLLLLWVSRRLNPDPLGG